MRHHAKLKFNKASQIDLPGQTGKCMKWNERISGKCRIDMNRWIIGQVVGKRSLMWQNASYFTTHKSNNTKMAAF